MDVFQPELGDIEVVRKQFSYTSYILYPVPKKTPNVRYITYEIHFRNIDSASKNFCKANLSLNKSLYEDLERN